MGNRQRRDAWKLPLCLPSRQSLAVQSVEANVAFGLKQEGLTRQDIAGRVADMLALVKLEGFGARKPHELSGGQRQRVALARSPGQASARALARRTAGSARQETARRDTVRADGAAAPARAHVHHRHPRPERGDDRRRPHRRDGSRPAHAGGRAGGHLRAAEVALGRGLRRRRQFVRGPRRRRPPQRRRHGGRPAAGRGADRGRTAHAGLGRGAAGANALTRDKPPPGRRTASPERSSRSAIWAICRSIRSASPTARASRPRSPIPARDGGARPRGRTKVWLSFSAEAAIVLTR